MEKLYQEIRQFLPDEVCKLRNEVIITMGSVLTIDEDQGSYRFTIHSDPISRYNFGCRESLIYCIKKYWEKFKSIQLLYDGLIPLFELLDITAKITNRAGFFLNFKFHWFLFTVQQNLDGTFSVYNTSAFSYPRRLSTVEGVVSQIESDLFEAVSGYPRISLSYLNNEFVVDDLEKNDSLSTLGDIVINIVNQQTNLLVRSVKPRRQVSYEGR